MADALTAKLQQPEIDAVPFADRLAVLVDIQHSSMLIAALAQHLTRAGIRLSSCMEHLDLRKRCGLDRSTAKGLASGLSIRQYGNVLIGVSAEIGKSWISCALGSTATHHRPLDRRQDLARLEPSPDPEPSRQTGLSERASL